MGKRSAVVELFLGDMGSIQRETRPSIQREDQLTMETKLEQIAASAVKQLPKSVGAGNPHATFCGNRGRATASGDPVGVETGATGDLARHRQTKGAATDMSDLQPPRHTSTLHNPAALAALDVNGRSRQCCQELRVRLPSPQPTLTVARALLNCSLTTCSRLGSTSHGASRRNLSGRAL